LPRKQDLKHQVLEWIDSNEDNIVGYLQDLIRIPSVNPWFFTEAEASKEQDVQRYLARHLESLGGEVSLWEADADQLTEYEGMAGYYAGRDFTGRPNLSAVFPGSGGGKSLLLTGHVDVVMAGTKWSKDPFGGEIEGGKIYGRGTVDMKGGMTAMIKALEAVRAQGAKLKGTVTVGSVVDEEAGGMGTLDFIHQGYRADACILTEATNLSIAPMCRGILWGKLIIPGRSGHIEMPQGDWRTGGAVDAIDKTSLYLQHFRRLNEDWSIRKQHPLLSIPCQLLVAEVHAGEYPTSYANRSEIVFNAQYLPSERDEKNMGGRVKKEIEQFIQTVAETDGWLKENPPQVEWMIDADCGETDVKHPFIETCTNVLRELNIEPLVQGQSSHTDMGWPINVGIPTINFGPGESRLAHQSDEYLSISELIQATKAIALTIIDWCEVEEDQL
jgi:acetylornithine deacetylase